ncbi:MAG: OsmC family protein [Tissierella sp.]|nr:OsmC family protein [Tissierella sp.]
MDLVKVVGKSKGNLAFEVDLNGHKLITDASVENGGDNLGPGPKSLLLAGLIGCTGIDVGLILKKMRVEYDDLDIEVETYHTDDQPRVYKDIHMIYRFKGKNIPLDKVTRAVDLSMEQYCGVSAMLAKHTPITYEVVLED